MSTKGTLGNKTNEAFAQALANGEDSFVALQGIMGDEATPGKANKLTNHPGVKRRVEALKKPKRGRKKQTEPDRPVNVPDVPVAE